MSAFGKLGIRTLLPLQGLVELKVKNFILSDHHSYCHGHLIFDVLMRMQEGLFSHMPVGSTSDIVLCNLFRYFISSSSQVAVCKVLSLKCTVFSFWLLLLESINDSINYFSRLACHLKVALP